MIRMCECPKCSLDMSRQTLGDVLGKEYMDIKDLISSLAPAAFGLLGTVAGAIITYLAAHAERRSSEDNEARARLADILNAIDRILWTTRVGAMSLDDAAPGALSEKLRLSI